MIAIRCLLALLDKKNLLKQLKRAKEYIEELRSLRIDENHKYFKFCQSLLSLFIEKASRLEKAENTTEQDMFSITYYVSDQSWDAVYTALTFEFRKVPELESTFEAYDQSFSSVEESDPSSSLGEPEQSKEEKETKSNIVEGKLVNDFFHIHIYLNSF